MIPLETFLQCVQENADRVREYEQGHDGSDGKCDCIGLIIGAVKLAGGTWPGTHGSNWAARNAMSGLEHIADAGKMFPGEIVYKAKEPGEGGYSLPDRYKDSGDLRDYYHVGVVTGVNPLQITHCTGVPGGIKYDSIMGNWRWGGKLKYVSYEQEGPDMETPYLAKVYAYSGKTVNLRAKPDKKSTIIARVEIGETVTVLDNLNEWDQVSYKGKTGYMMDNYLVPMEDSDEPEDGDTVAVPRAMLEEWETAMEEMAEQIHDLLGRG